MRCDFCHRDRTPGDACLEPGCPLRRDRQADPLNPANPASPLNPIHTPWPGHSSRDDTDAHRHHDPESAP